MLDVSGRLQRLDAGKIGSPFSLSCIDPIKKGMLGDAANEYT